MKAISPARHIVTPVIIIGASLLVLIALFLHTSNAFAATERPSESGKRILTIHDKLARRGILTSKTTVREALHEAGIMLSEHDRSEPALDEKLDGANYQVNLYRARPVVIVDGVVKKKVLTPYYTGKQIAKDAGIALQDEDTVRMEQSTSLLADGVAERMVITRATQFTFEFYGKTEQAYTQARTVGDMLREKRITMGKDDELSVPKSTPITAGMMVKLWRNGIQTMTEEQDVDYPVETIKDANKEAGTREVQTPGVKGKRTVTYEVNMQNGKEVSRREINSVTTKEPVKEVVVVGTKFSNSFSGSFSEALARLRSCEGSYTSNTGNGYYGAYQYDIQTWGGYMGYANASLAPPEVQDQKVWETYQRRGWQPWPSCRIKMGLQDIYR